MKTIKKLTNFANTVENRVEKFVLVIAKNKFVIRYGGYLHDKGTVFGENVLIGVKKTGIFCVRSHKYIKGRQRLNIFLNKLLNDFYDEHNNLVWLIESSRESTMNPEYDLRKEVCKKKITAIIRAKNRMHTKKLTNSSMYKRIVLTRNNEMRFQTKEGHLTVYNR